MSAAVDLDTPLVWLSPQDAFTIRNACEGIQIFGAIGAGKSSGSGQTFAKAYLRAGFGGLVLCAKKEEREVWERYAHETGRSKDLLLFSPDAALRFNFLDYELKRGGKGAGITENIVRLLTTVIEAVEMQKRGGGGHGDRYWVDTLKQILKNSIELVSLARGQVSMPLLYNVLLSAPRDPAQVDDEDWEQSSLCSQLLDEIEDKIEAGALTEMQRQDYDLVVRYFLVEFPGLAEKTRSIIVSSFTSFADLFLRGLLRELFSTKTNILPEFTFAGKILILDMPVLEYGEMGKIAAILMKYMFQLAVLRREVAEYPRPVFLWADEAQNFISSFDPEFQAQCRSMRGCTVYLSQNVPLYKAVIGGGDSNDRVSAFLGNLQTKVFHQQSDSVTNLWGADLFGKNWEGRHSINTGTQGTPSTTLSESLEYIVQPITFTTLRKGGPHNALKVDAIMYKGGDVWVATGKSYLKATFSQQT